MLNITNDQYTLQDINEEGTGSKYLMTDIIGYKFITYVLHYWTTFQFLFLKLFRVSLHTYVRDYTYLPLELIDMSANVRMHVGNFL